MIMAKSFNIIFLADKTGSIHTYNPNHLMFNFYILYFQVLEEIRLGLELNDYGMQQRRIAHMRFLGELYNYEHVDSSVIFETFYLILVFGHDTAEVSTYLIY